VVFAYALAAFSSWGQEDRARAGWRSLEYGAKETAVTTHDVSPLLVIDLLRVRRRIYMTKGGFEGKTKDLYDERVRGRICGTVATQASVRHR
jgi:hypothetical protein